MPESLYALAFLACPVGMGLMMWMMMRGHKNQPDANQASKHQLDELSRMQAQIDQLRADKRQADVGAVRQPAP